MHADVACQVFQSAGKVEQVANFFAFLDLGLELRFGFDGLGQRQRLVGFERNQLGQLVTEIVRQVENASDVADDRFRRHRAEGGDLRDRVGAVFLAHIFDDAPAVVLAEVDVEVGHRNALGIQEALEQQGVAQWVEVGDAEREGDQRTGTRTAPRTDRNAIILGPVDEVGNDQEVARETHLHDGFRFDVQAILVGRSLRLALGLIGEQLPQALSRPRAAS